MRVLWFTSSPCGYEQSNSNRGYNGGGWMGAVEQEIKKRQDIELGVCFPMDGQPFKTSLDGVTYYPIKNHSKSFRDKIIDAVRFYDVTRDMAVWRQYISQIDAVIDDFKPNVIQTFGSEVYIQLAALSNNNIPKILHIQGLLSLYIYIYHPNGISPITDIFRDWNVKKIYGRHQYWVNWKRSCYREQEIFKNVQHVIGRTDWDKAGAAILNPKAEYHYGGEVLRPVFYEQHERTIPKTLTITTTSSGATYKGFDFVLKVADILKNKMQIDFIWKVFGNVDPTFFEKVTHLRHKELNIQLCGVASAEQLCDEICQSTLYFQPSYIENSPNSVCEAQMLGVTPIATNVGGTSSIIENNVTGLLVPAGEPYYAAYQIMRLMNNEELNRYIGINAQSVAIKRHDKDKIVDELIKTYKSIL